MFLKFILLICTILLSNCAFVTKFEEFSFRAEHETFNINENIWVYVNIKTSKSVQNIFGPFYDHEIYGSPYPCYVTVWGNFKRIVEFSIVFDINNGKDSIQLDINTYNLNYSKKTRENGDSYYPAGNFELDLDWKSVKNLSAKIFLSIEDNNQIKEFNIKGVFKKFYNKSVGPRWFFYAMSV